MRRALLFTVLIACVDTGADDRQIELSNTISHADEALIRSRPELTGGKYLRMAATPVDYQRGSLSVYLHDVRVNGANESRFSMNLLVPSLGDAHPENFGTMRASDGTFALEPNDFDAADHAPFLWDVRRLACGIALAATIAGHAPDRRSVARASALAYANGPAGRIAGGSDPIVADAFSRSTRDLLARRELGEFTVSENGIRRLIRGVIDPTDTQNTLGNIALSGLQALPQTLERYRSTLLAPPPPEFFTVLDAAREFGSGVGSWPRVRVIVLVRGPSDSPDDDVLLEMKELTDSTIAGLYPPGVYADDLGTRVRVMSRAAWARPDAAPLWGTSTWLGLPVQIREETEANKTIRISRMVGDRGTTDAVTSLATTLGGIVARVHASPEVHDRIGADIAGFADEQADYADRCAGQVLDDQARFILALRRLGPRLGIPFDPIDTPNADEAALFGMPPPLPAIP